MHYTFPFVYNLRLNAHSIARSGDLAPNRRFLRVAWRQKISKNRLRFFLKNWRFLKNCHFWRFFGDFRPKIGFFGDFDPPQNFFKIFEHKIIGDFPAIFNKNGKNRQWRQKFGKLAIFRKYRLATLVLYV